MKVSVIGLGYVGSVVAAGVAAAGHEVLGVDIDQRKVEALRNGDPLLFEPSLAQLIRGGLIEGHLRYAHIDEVKGDLGDIVVIATGTPALPTGAADLSQVRAAIEWVKQVQPGGALVIMKSTVPPGTGRKIVERDLSGTPFLYASTPEFLREGQALNDWFHPDRLVIGAEQPQAAEMAKELYRGIEAPFVITDVTSAEMIKYAANAFLATKISFINEIAAICELVGGNVDDVTHGIALDRRIGPSFLKPGLGYGGSCFPKDVRALDYLSSANGYSFELLRAVITVNNRQRLLPFRALKTVFGSLYRLEVAVLGLTFKPQTDDLREAPSVELIRLLTEEGAAVRAYDPVANKAAAHLLPKVVRFYDEPLAAVADAQAVILVTEWPQIVTIDWQKVYSSMRSPHFLFDGRNALDAVSLRRMGFDYHAVGRPLTGFRVDQAWGTAAWVAQGNRE